MLVLLGLVLLAAPPPGDEGSFARCDEQLGRASRPSEDEAYMCAYRAAQRSGRWDEAEAYLTARVASLPSGHAWTPWLGLALAHTRSHSDPERAKEDYAAVADAFAGRGEGLGEVLARVNLVRLLLRAGATQRAEAEIDRAAEAAERSGDAEAVTRSRLARADFLAATGGSLAEALRLLRGVESGVLAGTNAGLKKQCLGSKARVAFALGRFDEATLAWERLLDMLRAEENPFDAASVVFNIANARLWQLEDMPSEAGRLAVLEQAEAALELARRAGNRRSEMYSRRLIADLLPRTPQEHSRAREHLDRCIALAAEMGFEDRRAECLWTLAEYLADVDPAAAPAAAARALDGAMASGTPRALALAWRGLANASWKTKPFDAAVRDASSALAAIESLRALQEGGEERAELFSDWTVDYYRLSGNLLRQRPASHASLALAFDVIERMRARVLLESVEAAGRLPRLPEEHPLARRRRAALEAVASVQRRLLDPRLAAHDRREALGDLVRLEAEEEAAREALREAVPGYAIREPEFASLDAVRGALEEDEAMLSFQVGLENDVRGDFGGGSWLLLLTREGVRVLQIPDRVALETVVPVFLGLLQRRDGGGHVASARLHRDLVRQALDGLPRSVDRLVVVPDGALSRLPFAVLREVPDAGPLAGRFEVSTAPSATLWLRWRQGGARAGSSALALADPTLGGGAVAVQRAAILREGLELGALPHARREGRAIARHLGGGVELLVGEAATERAVKERSLDRFAILHFAAHAVTDEEDPERSAIVLAPGGPAEDGLLQVREIRELALDGKLVVLSACRSAAGRRLSGEGLLSLARAFFQAGAHAVIGSQWPVRDDEAAFLFDRFYRAIAEGRRAAEALALAQRAAIAEGLPEAAWAAVVLYGDGALRPVQPAVAKSDRSLPTYALLLAALVVVGYGWRRLARHRRGSRHRP